MIRIQSECYTSFIMTTCSRCDHSSGQSRASGSYIDFISCASFMSISSYFNLICFSGLVGRYYSWSLERFIMAVPRKMTTAGNPEKSVSTKMESG